VKLSTPVETSGKSPQAEALVQLRNELEEQKGLHRKALEEYHALRAEYRASEERRYAAEHRAMVAEYELSRCNATATTGNEPAAGFSEAKRAKHDTEVLLKAIAAVADDSVLAALHKSDAEVRTAAEVEVERQRRASLWDALSESADTETVATIARNIQGAGLPVAAARRLFEASPAAKSSEITPRGRKSGVGESTYRQPIAGNRVQPPFPPMSEARDKRLSLPASYNMGGVLGTCVTPGRNRRESAGSGTDANNDKATADATPNRTFPGGRIVATPQSASVRDRIRALESSGRRN
jgi:hypothetical protein